MKRIREISLQSQLLLTALFLTSIWSLMPGLGMPSAIAQSSMLISQVSPNTSADQIPQSIANAVLEKAAQQSGVPSKSLRITKAQKWSWAYGCERSTSRQPCDPVVVDGWQVVLESGNKVWVYVTDQQGHQIRLIQGDNSTGDGSLPKTVLNTVLKLASERLNVPPDQFGISQLEPQMWSDTCLGLAVSKFVCQKINVPGWRVAVYASGQKLVYRTNQSGSLAQIDPAATELYQGVI